MGTILVSLKPVVLPKSENVFIVGTSYVSPIHCRIRNYEDTLQIRIGDVFTITKTDPIIQHGTREIVLYGGYYDLRPETIPNFGRFSTLNLNCKQKKWIVIPGSRSNAFVSVGVVQGKSFYVFAPTSGFGND